MSYTKDIVCLANSKKFSEHCVAGKELHEGEFAGWVRPVSSTSGGALSSENICFPDGKAPGHLDVVRILIKRRVAHRYQTENYLIDSNKCWEQVSKLDSSRLDSLCDRVEKLWINGFDSAKGINDRIPIEKTKKISSSLLLIKPSSMIIHKEYEFGSHSWKIRADFRYRRIRYRIVITDPVVEAKYRGKEKGDYPVDDKDVYLTVSLGEEYKGFCYKLAAAVIPGPKK